MSEIVERPQHVGKKVKTKDNFELCYLRHQYLRKVTFNPTEAQMRPFHNIIRVAARRTFFTYMNIFKLVGFEVDDLINVGKVHLTSYIGLFALERKSSKLDKFTDKFYDLNGVIPEESDLLDKNKADFTMFLKQRMEELVRVCRQKAKDIKGLPTDEYLVFYGKQAPPENLVSFDDIYTDYGYRKLDVSLFKTIKKKIRDQDGPVYTFNSMFYVVVPLDHRNLSFDDLVGSDLNPYNNIVNMNPEELMAMQETEQRLEYLTRDFLNKPKKVINRKLRNFIDANKNDPRYSVEVKAAKKMLK